MKHSTKEPPPILKNHFGCPVCKKQIPIYEAPSNGKWDPSDPDYPERIDVVTCRECGLTFEPRSKQCIVLDVKVSVSNWVHLVEEKLSTVFKDAELTVEMHGGKLSERFFRHKLKPLIDRELESFCNLLKPDCSTIEEAFEIAKLGGKSPFKVEEALLVAAHELRRRWKGLVTKARAKTPQLNPFPAPEGLRWEEVTFTLISEEQIRIRARDIVRDYRYAQIGLADRRNQKPNKQWLILLWFAGQRGEFDRGRAPHKNTFEQQISRLRKRLCEFVGIKDDPFKIEGDYYRTKFTVSSEFEFQKDVVGKERN